MTLPKSPACRQEEESVEDCVARKIPEIKDEHPDWDDDKVQAVAFSICDESCSDKRRKNMTNRNSTYLSKSFGVPLIREKELDRNEKGQPLIRGFFTSDNVDEVGDIITRKATEGAIPKYRAWGNIRYMHQPKPVAVVERIGKEDGLKWNEVEIRVVDPDAIFAVEEGLLKALSVGIIIKDFEDVSFTEDGGLIIESYALAEISLVDHPANYDAVLNLDGGKKERVYNYAIPGMTLSKALSHDLNEAAESSPEKILEEEMSDNTIITDSSNETEVSEVEVVEAEKGLNLDETTEEVVEEAATEEIVAEAETLEEEVVEESTKDLGEVEETSEEVDQSEDEAIEESEIESDPEKEGSLEEETLTEEQEVAFVTYDLSDDSIERLTRSIVSAITEVFKGLSEGSVIEQDQTEEETEESQDEETTKSLGDVVGEILEKSKRAAIPTEELPEETQETVTEPTDLIERGKSRIETINTKQRIRPRK